MLELRASSCFPPAIVAVYSTLACIDAAIAVFAFCQVLFVPNFYHFLWVLVDVFVSFVVVVSS